MSRIAKKPILIPQGIKVVVEKGFVRVEGPKGKMSQKILDPIEVKVQNNEVHVNRRGNGINEKTRQGTLYRLIANMINGVLKGYQKGLLIEGVGFKAESKGQSLSLNLGFTHPVVVPVPEGITVKIGKPTEVTIEGSSKELVGLFAARIRSIYEPEPYKGKGIRYSDEVIRRKAGKAVTK